MEAEPPRSPALADGDGEGPVVAPRDHVDRDADEGALDDALAPECARAVLPAEAFEPRPETDVRRGGVLRLQAADLLERARDRELRPLEQKLPREQRAVQLSLGQLHRTR